MTRVFTKYPLDNDGAVATSHLDTADAELMGGEKSLVDDVVPTESRWALEELVGQAIIVCGKWQHSRGRRRTEDLIYLVTAAFTPRES